MGFNVLQWNCRSLTQVQEHLVHFLANNITYHLLCLQSTNLQSQSLPNIPGYQFPPATTDHGGKVQTVTYVINKLSYKLVSSPDGNIPKIRHSTTVQIKLNNKITNIVNVYFPSTYSSAPKSKWLELLSPDHSWIILGDFNAHHPLWEIDCSRNTGQSLVDQLDKSNLIILNDGASTRCPIYSAPKPTAIDLTLATPELLVEYQTPLNPTINLYQWN